MNGYLNISIYKQEKGLLATFPCSQAPPCQGLLGRGSPPPLPALGQGLQARLQGNTATN